MPSSTGWVVVEDTHRHYRKPGQISAIFGNDQVTKTPGQQPNPSATSGGLGLSDGYLSRLHLICS